MTPEERDAEYAQTLAAIKAWDDVIEFCCDMQDVLHEDIKKYEARLEMARENGTDYSGLLGIVRQLRTEYYWWFERENDAVEAAHEAAQETVARVG